MMEDFTALKNRVENLEAQLAAAHTEGLATREWAEGIQTTLLVLVPPLLKALPDVAATVIPQLERRERVYEHLLRGGAAENSKWDYESSALLARVLRQYGVGVPAG